MFCLGSTTKRLAAALLITAVSVMTATAQGTKRQRRETNANRQARIQRTIDDTYSHRYEIFGGGGYLRFRPGEYLKRTNEVTWAASGTYFLNQKLGVTADIRGSYGNAKLQNVFALSGDFTPQISEYMFMGGPTYRFYATQKYAVSAFATAGIAMPNFSGGNKGVDSQTVGLWYSNNRPVFSAGVNFDYNLYPNLAFRFTPTFVGTTFQGTTATGPIATGGSNVGSFQYDLGANAGFVYRFGRIK